MSKIYRPSPDKKTPHTDGVNYPGDGQVASTGSQDDGDLLPGAPLVQAIRDLHAVFKIEADRNPLLGMLDAGTGFSESLGKIEGQASSLSMRFEALRRHLAKRGHAHDCDSRHGEGIPCSCGWEGIQPYLF